MSTLRKDRLRKRAEQQASPTQPLLAVQMDREEVRAIVWAWADYKVSWHDETDRRIANAMTRCSQYLRGLLRDWPAQQTFPVRGTWDSFLALIEFALRFAATAERRKDSELLARSRIVCTATARIAPVLTHSEPDEPTPEPTDYTGDVARLKSEEPGQPLHQE